MKTRVTVTGERNGQRLAVSINGKTIWLRNAMWRAYVLLLVRALDGCRWVTAEDLVGWHGAASLRNSICHARKELRRELGDGFCFVQSHGNGSGEVGYAVPVAAKNIKFKIAPEDLAQVDVDLREILSAYNNPKR